MIFESEVDMQHHVIVRALGTGVRGGAGFPPDQLALIQPGGGADYGLCSPH